MKILIWKLIKGYYKFFVVYVLLCIPACFILMLSIAWSISLQTNCSYSRAFQMFVVDEQVNGIPIFIFFLNQFTHGLPFSDILDSTFDNMGSLSIFNGVGALIQHGINAFKDIESKEDFRALSVSLLPEMIKIALSFLTLYIFEKLKGFFKWFTGLSVTIATIFSAAFWTVTSYYLANCIVTWIDKCTITLAVNRFIAYYCIFLFLVILSALLRAIEHKTNIFPFILELLLDCLIGILNAVEIWVLSISCTSLLNIAGCILSFLIYLFVIDLIKLFLLKKSFPGFPPNLFIKNTILGKLNFFQ